MRLVASTPNSKPVPESIRDRLAAISQNNLREVVERICVPRPTGTPENEAVRRSIIELFCCTEAGRLGVEVDEAGNVGVGDPRRAKILIGADCHGPTETRETLDYEFLAGVTRLLVHVVLSEFRADRG